MLRVLLVVVVLCFSALAEAAPRPSEQRLTLAPPTEEEVENVERYRWILKQKPTVVQMRAELRNVQRAFLYCQVSRECGINSVWHLKDPKGQAVKMVNAALSHLAIVFEAYARLKPGQDVSNILMLLYRLKIFDWQVMLHLVDLEVVTVEEMGLRSILSMGIPGGAPNGYREFAFALDERANEAVPSPPQ